MLPVRQVGTHLSVRIGTDKEVGVRTRYMSRSADHSLQKKEL